MPVGLLSILTSRGEELSVPEVLDIPAEKRQDPRFWNTGGADIGRDGCRVPLPWTASEKDNYGFSTDAKVSEAHLPQPKGWGSHSVEKLGSDDGSTLAMYRKALALRKQLQGSEDMDWQDGSDDLLVFDRPGGWRVVLNGGADAVDLPEHSEVLVASASLQDGKLPIEAAVWLKV